MIKRKLMVVPACEKVHLRMKIEMLNHLSKHGRVQLIIFRVGVPAQPICSPVEPARKMFCLDNDPLFCQTDECPLNALMNEGVFGAFFPTPNCAAGVRLEKEGAVVRNVADAVADPQGGGQGLLVGNVPAPHGWPPASCCCCYFLPRSRLCSPAELGTPTEVA